MSTAKVVNRNIAVVLAVICIITIVALMGVVSYYPSTVQSKDSQIIDLQNQLATTQAWLNGNLSELNTLSNELSSLTLNSSTVTGTLTPTTSGSSGSNSDLISSLQDTISSLKTTITGLNNQVGNLTSQLDTATGQVNTLEGQNSQLTSQNIHLQSELTSNTSALALGENTVWVSSQTVSQPAGGLGISYSSWTFSAADAGYVIVNVQSSSTSSTDIQVTYTYGQLSYNSQITNIGQSGSRWFPVLPSNVQISVGNGNLIGGATETVTITYIY